MQCKPNSYNCFTNHVLPKETDLLDNWLTKSNQPMNKGLCSDTEVLGGSEYLSSDQYDVSRSITFDTDIVEILI